MAHPLTAAMIRVLGYLKAHRGARHVDFEDEIGLRSHTAAYWVIDALVARGLISECEGDYPLTSAGCAALAAAKGAA